MPGSVVEEKDEAKVAVADTPEYKALEKTVKDLQNSLNAANETITSLQEQNKQYLNAYTALNTKFENLAELYNLITERYLLKERPQK